MAIYYCENEKIFHLQGSTQSFVMKVTENGTLIQLYWGKRLEKADIGYLEESFPSGASFELQISRLPLEIGTRGTGLYQIPSLAAVNKDGNDITVLTYVSHKITSGKRKLEGLPATYTENESEAETLTVTFEDKLTGLICESDYTLFKDPDCLARSMRIVNNGSETLKLTHALSASAWLYGHDYDFIHLKGAHARERALVRGPIGEATQIVESQRGASGHEENPFICITERSTTEFSGNVWAMNLVYSGSFRASIEVNNIGNTRASIGLNSEVFAWTLGPNESFCTPEAVLVFSADGLNGMSHKYHKLYRTRLARGYWRDRERPILINNWEATYFDFNEEKLLKIAENAKNIGVELFVLDDGWFGKRNSDNCSLGDWYVNKAKLPGGIKGVAEKITALGLRFGLWFEPEMISEDSDLYRAHPDWCLHAPGRFRTPARQQLILDMSRTEVQDYIIESISNVLNSAPISYVKWDMNRNMTEYYSFGRETSKQLETQHRYMLGLYRVLEVITSRFPEILFESCSGGGGRFDAGFLYYMPQTWTSDDTDPAERLKIQYSTSLPYPTAAMGAHVSASPNHQTGRLSDVRFRGDVALAGNFGYELDLSVQTPETLSAMKEQVETVKRLRSVLQKGTFTRILSPYEGIYTAWQFVSEDENKVILCVYRTLAEPTYIPRRIKLNGLDESAEYTEVKSGKKYSGSALVNAGIFTPRMHGDCVSYVLEFEKVN